MGIFQKMMRHTLLSFASLFHQLQQEGRFHVAVESFEQSCVKKKNLALKKQTSSISQIIGQSLLETLRNLLEIVNILLILEIIEQNGFIYGKHKNKLKKILRKRKI